MSDEARTESQPLSAAPQAVVASSAKSLTTEPAQAVPADQSPATPSSSLREASPPQEAVTASPPESETSSSSAGEMIQTPSAAGQEQVVSSGSEATSHSAERIPPKAARVAGRGLVAGAVTAEELEAQKRAELEALDEEIERELQGALAEAEQLQSAEVAKPAQPLVKRRIQEPAKRRGVILRVSGSDVFVDIGGRTQGILPLEQFPDAPPRPGQEVEVTIRGYDEKDGLVLLERPGIALAQASWASIAVGTVVEARVTAVIKGGLEVNVSGIRGFIPASQVDVHRVEDLTPYVGQCFPCQVMEANPQEETLVLSRRAVLEKERQQAQEQLWQELAEGQVRTGIVRSVQDYGAFVDLGHGVEGLLHVSEMSWSRRVHPAELLQPGQEVRVAIIKLDRQNKKIGLSLKQVQGSPWDRVEDKYPVGTIVTGKVVRLAEFGAFVELEPGVEGLVHISEVSPQRVRRVEEVVKLGDEVRAQVIKVDRVAKRISLSMKAVQAAEEEELAPRLADTRRSPATSSRRRPLKGGLD